MDRTSWNATTAPPPPNATVYVTDFAAWRPYFYICYIIFGGFALFANLLILATLIKDKKLLAKWPTVTSLAIGNLTTALHAFCYGSYRLPLIQTGIIDRPLSIWFCMGSFIPTCHVLSYSVPPVVQCIIGIERIVAICAFNWYRIHWSPKKTWYSIGIICSATSIAAAAPLWYKVISNPFTVTLECSSPKIIGLDYLFAVIRFAIVVGVASAVCSIGAAVVGRFRMKKVKPADKSQMTDENRQVAAQFKRQMKVAISMMVVALFDLVLVTVPSILTVVQLSFPMPDSAKISFYTVSYCIYSGVNIIVCVVMNSSLRAAVTKSLHIMTCKKVAILGITATKVETIMPSQATSFIGPRSTTKMITAVHE